MTKRKLKAAKAIAADPTPAPQLQTYPDRVVPECVTLARSILADVAAGRIKAFAIAMVSLDNKTGSASAAAPGDVEVIHVLNSAIGNLFWSHNKAVIG